jgi:hypothetical protein
LLKRHYRQKERRPTRMTQIEERWEALVPDPDKPIFQLLDAEHPLGFYIGRQMSGERLFLLIDSERPPELKSMRALQISSFQRPDGRWGTLLCLLMPELAGIFALLCRDLVESSRHLPSGVSGPVFLGQRLGSWRLLLEQRRADVLSNSEVRGLFAELFILSRSLSGASKPREVVRAWVGPLGADQDFQMAEVAWEVKSVQPDAITVPIASDMQLYSSSRKLLLLVLTLSETGSAEGLSLNELVCELRDQVDAEPDTRSLLDERLNAAGYLVRREYDDPRFEVRRMQAFAVRENFPRLARPYVPPGISDVRYAVTLAACTPFAVDWPFAIH